MILKLTYAKELFKEGHHKFKNKFCVSTRAKRSVMKTEYLEE